MISYIIEGILLVALVATSIQVAFMYRELRRLRRHHGEYRAMLDDTGDALDAVESAVRDINSRGAELVMSLGERIEHAEDLLGRLEHRIDAARGSFADIRAPRQSPFLAYSTADVTPLARAQPVRRFQDPGIRPAAYASPAPVDYQPRQHRPEEPTLGDYLGNWRGARSTELRAAPLWTKRV